MPDRLLTIQEAADRLNVKKSLVSSLIYRRELVQTKVGRLTRIAESDLEDYIASRKVKAS